MAHTAAEHAQSLDPEEHHPHIVALGSYFAVWVALLILTVLTVAVSYFNFGEWNLVIALLIATIKATCVATIFMHLYYDSKFNSVVLVSGLIFLVIFISFTSFDIFGRGLADPIEGQRPAITSDPFAEPPPAPATPAAEHGEHGAEHK